MKKSSPKKKSSAKTNAPTNKAALMKRVLPWVAVAIVALALAFLVFTPSAGGVKIVDSAQLVAAQAKGAQVVDVRTTGEYQLGHIPGAVNVPVDQFQATAQSWDRKATYVVYCASGERSAEAVKIMQSMGFKSIDHFNKGIGAWTGQLEKGKTTSQQTVPTNGKPVFIEFYTDS